MKYDNPSLFLIYDTYGSVLWVNSIHRTHLSVLMAICKYYINVKPILKWKVYKNMIQSACKLR